MQYSKQTHWPRDTTDVAFTKQAILPEVWPGLVLGKTMVLFFISIFVSGSTGRGFATWTVGLSDCGINISRLLDGKSAPDTLCATASRIFTLINFCTILRRKKNLHSEHWYISKSNYLAVFPWVVRAHVVLLYILSEKESHTLKSPGLL